MLSEVLFGFWKRTHPSWGNVRTRTTTLGCALPPYAHQVRSRALCRFGRRQAYCTEARDKT